MKRILSLGAGVQSTTLLLMSCRGELPRLDAAIFADTQWESQDTYAHLQWLMDYVPSTYGIPIHVVTKGSIKFHALDYQVRGTKANGQRWASMPYAVDNDNPGGWRIRRQCTSEYKIQVIEKFLRLEILGLAPRQRSPKTPEIEHWYGISVDEAQRMRESRHPWSVNQYPLCNYPITMLPAPMTRGHCLEWLKKYYPDRYVPRSSCIACPYKSDSEWRSMMKLRPDEWQDAVSFDAAIRKCGGMRGDVYVHRSRKPLSEAVTDDSNQPELWGEECAGICGV